MRKIFSLFVAFSLALGVVGCSSTSEEPAEEVVEKEEKTDDDKVVPYTYMFDYEDYPKPDYDALDYVDLGDYDTKEIVVSGVLPKYTKKDIESKLKSMLYGYSTIERSDDKTLGKNDAIECTAFYRDAYEEALKEDSETDQDDYTFYNTLINIADMDKDSVAIIKNAKRGDTVTLTIDGVAVRCTLDYFGKFVPFTEKDVTKQWLVQNTGYKTLSELKAGLRKKLESNSRTVIFNTIYTSLMDSCEVNVPDDLLMYHLNKEMYSLDVRVGARGKYKDLDDYFSNKDKTLDEYVLDCRDRITDFIKGRLILEAIVKLNKVKPDKSLYDDFIEYSMESTSEEFPSVEAYKKDVGDEELKYNFRNIYTGLVWCKENLNIKYE